MELFKKVVKTVELSIPFQTVDSQKAFGPAKNVIDEIARTMKDKDGNFAQQFQTTGFYQRLWEIFLHAFFNENDFQISDQYDRPDFFLKKNGHEFFVEACSSNPAVDDKFTNEFIDASMKAKDAKEEQNIKDYYTMKIGSILFSKLNKKYWELNWVKDKPFVLAVMPSHNKLASFIPDYLTIEYAYGKWFKGIINENGEMGGTSGIKVEHTYESKTIPSGFFSQPGAEYISALIFTNTCELQKFNRMGQQAKYYDEDLIILRMGQCNNNEPKGAPIYFRRHVLPGEELETWSEGVSILHNPNAKFPLDRKLFKGVRQVWVAEDGRLDGEMPEFYPFHSITGVVARID